jgi:hypothetical protein
MVFHDLLREVAGNERLRTLSRDLGDFGCFADGRSEAWKCDRWSIGPRPPATSDGYVYLHSIVDGSSRLAYTDPLADEKGQTAATFLTRAKVWFAPHGITHLHHVVSKCGSCYRSNDFTRIVGRRTRRQRTRPHTPRHDGKGKVVRYQRILPQRSSRPANTPAEDDRSAAISVWNIHDNYHRPHSAAGDRRPASGLASRHQRPGLIHLGRSGSSVGAVAKPRSSSPCASRKPVRLSSPPRR